MGFTLASLLTFILIVVMLLQIPFIQTKVTQFALSKLSNSIEGEVSIGKIYLKPFSTLVIEDLVILDRYPFTNAKYPDRPAIDTLAFAKSISAQFSLSGLIAQEGIVIKKARIEHGALNMVSENNRQDNLSRIFGLAPSNKKPAEKDIFEINDVEVKDFRYRLINYRDTQTSKANGGINWNDLDVTEIYVKGDNLKMSHGITTGTAHEVRAKEKSGFTIKHLSGSAIVGKGKTIVNNLRLQDGNSDLQLQEYRMEYANVSSFKNYIHKVRMYADITSALVDFKTISYFAPSLEGCRERWYIKGIASGPVDSLNIEGIDIKTEKGGFKGHIVGSMTGLPDIDKTYLDAKISDFSMTLDGLGDFINRWSENGNLDLSTIAPNINWRVQAHAKGLLNKFRAKLWLSSSIGKTQADAMISNVASLQKDINITGQVSTRNLDLGRILGNGIIGPCTMEADLNTTFSKEKGTKVHMNSLAIERLYANGYDYSDIIAVGDLDSSTFNGKIISHDPALNFLFQGTFAFSPQTQNALYSFYMNAGMVDLNKLNIDTRGKSKLRFQAMANFKQTNDGNMLGSIKVSDMIVENSKNKKEIGNIELSSATNGKTYKIGLNSSFASANYTGSAPILNFINDLKSTALAQELPSLFDEKKEYTLGNEYEVDVEFYDSMKLLSYVMPGLYIADSTSLKASIDANGFFRLGLDSPRLAWNEHYIKNAHLVMDNADKELSGTLSSNKIKVASFILEDNRLNFKAGDDHIGLGYTYDNTGEMTNRGEFYVLGNFYRSPQNTPAIDINILPSELYLNSQKWSITPSRISYVDNNFKAYDVGITSGEQKLSIDGGVSSNDKDTLGVHLERMDISFLNHLTGMNLGIGGKTTGSALLISPLNDAGIIADIICDSTTISNELLGTLKAQCKWNEEFKRFDFNCNNNLAGKTSLDIMGNYSPKADFMEAKVDFDKFNVSYAKVFIQDIFNKVQGNISGEIIASGSPSSLNIKSNNTHLDDGLLQITYTNVPYKVNGNFDMDEYGVYFNDMSVQDRFGAKASLNGLMYYDHFKDMGFDLKMKAHQLEAVNLTEKQNEFFYGNVFASGNINLKGPMTGLLLEVDAITSKTGNIHIPLNSSSEAGTTNLLTFKEEEKEIWIDPYEAMMETFKSEKKAQSNFDVKIRVTATRDIEAFVEIDKETGNVLSGRGNGVISLDILSSKDIFDIGGDFTLESGKYHFVALGIASRDFSIKQGSTVRFNGDINNTTLDIDAIYQTKASLSSLIADDNSVSNRRTINCGINITGNMLSPRLKFDIEIPDLDPTIKSKVENALSTDDKVQKQFLSLIISNNFLPDEQSGIVNNSSVLYSNVSEIMSNQLNNIFEKLNIPIDLGLNYQPNDKGTDIFDVALSTKLFNNRVIVNGSVGNKQNVLGSTTNDVVGDLDIEIKLDKRGGWRINIFSHSADAYTNFLDNSQRNGVGITWQQEFNSLGKYFKTLFMNSENRRKAEQEEETAMIDGGRVNVRITKENYNYREDKKTKKIKRKKDKKLKHDRKR